ncbi:MAG TPA: tetratricopeptide repeat protein [candidate division Zixibacteria bacterium]|nr:tetratricopeptide repeat protein [candidate division Zixibacteria bacterium]
MVPLLAATATFAVFCPALWNGFVNWDDTTNFINNDEYRGLNWKNLRWMASTFLLGQWIPFTWLTLGIDYALWGMNPFGYHLTNVLLHCATTAVWYLVSRHLLALAFPSLGVTARDASALGAALFFAIHPLRAESVAWVTERRDVVSGLFFLLAVLGYLHARRPDARRTGLWPSIVCYILAALSKSIVVSLPVVLLLLDVYPLRRLNIRRRDFRALRQLLIEKAPYVAVAVATGIMAIWAQRHNHYLTPLDRLSLLDRVSVAIYGLWFYFTRTLVPVGLSPLYELPAKINFLEPRFLVPALGVLALTIAVTVLGRRWVALPVAAAAYAVILAPVSGLLHNGHQLVHDRYSYLSCLPWAILFGAAGALTIHASQHGLVRRPVARGAVLAMAAWLVALGTLTWQQVKVWRDDDTLWRYALDADSSCSICYANLGLSLASRNLPELAIKEFERALALRPDRLQTHSHLGVALLNAGRTAEALTYFVRVRNRNPSDLGNRNNMAVALLRLGRHAEGMAELRSILAQDPQNIHARANFATALLEARQVETGVALLERIIADRPDQVPARIALVRGYLALDRWEDARKALESLRRMDERAAQWLDGLFIGSW